MGIVSTVMKAGVVAKVVEEARKPENQQRVKDLVAKARGTVQARRR